MSENGNYSSISMPISSQTNHTSTQIIVRNSTSERLDFSVNSYMPLVDFVDLKSESCNMSKINEMTSGFLFVGKMI